MAEATTTQPKSTATPTKAPQGRIPDEMYIESARRIQVKNRNGAEKSMVQFTARNRSDVEQGHPNRKGMYAVANPGKDANGKPVLYHTTLMSKALFDDMMTKTGNKPSPEAPGQFVGASTKNPPLFRAHVQGYDKDYKLADARHGATTYKVVASGAEPTKTPAFDKEKNGEIRRADRAAAKAAAAEKAQAAAPKAPEADAPEL